MIRLSLLSVFSTFLLVVAAIPSAPLSSTCPEINGAMNATLQSLECRCGMAQFLTLPHANITSPSEAKQCSKYKLIDARGTAEPQGVSTMFYAMIQNILDKVPGGVSLPVEYPAGPTQTTTSGEQFVIDIINRGRETCPDEKYAFFGYSQGATLMLKVLDQLDCEAMKAVESVIFVGNPYRMPGKTSSFNGTGQHDDRHTIGMFAATAIAQNHTIPQLSPEMDESGKVQDFCLQDDKVCASDPNCACQLPAGHLSYGAVDDVQESAIQHVVNRLTGSKV